MISCPWCSKRFDAETSVVRHSSRVHKKKRADYDLLIKYNNIVPKCKCGCKKNVKYNDKKKSFNTFIRSHQMNDPKVKNRMVATCIETAMKPDVRLRNSNNVKQLWKNDDYRLKHMSQRCDSTSSWSQNRKKSNERRSLAISKKMSIKMTNFWASPKGDELRSKCNTPEHKQLLSIRTKQALDDPTIRLKLSLNAIKNQSLGVIGPNQTMRSWLYNPFIGKEEHLDSSWERTFLLEAIKRNVPIKRCTLAIPYIDENGDQRNTVPDFITVDGKVIVEIKGRKTPRDFLKIKSASLFCKNNFTKFVLVDTIKLLTSDHIWNTMTHE